MSNQHFGKYIHDIIYFRLGLSRFWKKMKNHEYSEAIKGIRIIIDSISIKPSPFVLFIR